MRAGYKGYSKRERNQEMKAKVINAKMSTKSIAYRDKPLHSQISILDRDTGQSVVTARFYYPGSVCYCALWVHGTNVYANGGGKAGGYGYHHESAALADAITDAGLALDEAIAGRGEHAMNDALHAVARAVTGKRKFFKVRAHA